MKVEFIISASTVNFEHGIAGQVDYSRGQTII